MPTYDLSCVCGHAFEIFRSKPISGKQRCPKCGKRRAVIRFGGGLASMCKGQGFYSTDNRTDGYKTKQVLHGAGEQHAERMSKAGIPKPNERRG